MKAIFECEIFESWKNGNWLLNLHLDSLDECLLRIDNVATLLADELPKQPVDRLRLRIACRTAPWPTILEKVLVDLFERSPAYELAPLRRIDVERAAEQSGIDPGTFLRRIDELDVSSLAIKPVTLKFLVGTYLKDGDLPKNHPELYEKGCRMLCEESSDSRRGADLRGRLNPEERLAVASRIAAVTQLCNRFAVFTGAEADGVPPEDVFVNDLAGGVEHADDEVRVSVDALQEVLGTGLFSSRGLNRIGWAHQTYAEFLAARYCKEREMPLPQVRPLIFHPSEGGCRLIPQLREVAGWMSAMEPQILESVVASDPEALLGAAAAGLSDEQRQLAVDALLRLASEGRTLHLEWGLIFQYPKLQHPKLPDQLRPYLHDEERPVGARHVAVDLARACNVEAVGPELADIALERSADVWLRRSAAAAAASVGSREVRFRLRPLAFGEVGDDPDDEFKGAGLMALWPELITAAELFPLLTPPKQSGLSGMYSRFLYDRAIEHLPVKDLPVALKWFSDQQYRVRLLGPIDRLMDRIIQFAWDNLDEVGVSDGLVTAIVSRMRLHDSIFSDYDDDAREFAKKIQDDHERRRKLLKAILPQVTVDRVSSLLMLRVPIMAPSDVEWFIDRILSGEAQDSLSVEVRLVRFAFDPRDRQMSDKLWRACQLNPALDAECGCFFSVQLESEAAKILREQLKDETERKTPKFLTPTPSERIEASLRKIEAGNIAFWSQLTSELTLEPTSTHYGSAIDLTATPGWKSADTATRNRILDAAVLYLQKGDPRNDDWFRTSTIFGEAVAGSCALALLMMCTQEARLDGLSKEQWAKWVPILLRFHSTRRMTCK